MANDRLVPEGNGDNNEFEVGDSVEYAGNWVFEGSVIHVSNRTVRVAGFDGNEVKEFDHADLNPISD